jgi:ligand-binding sensor domain-containing protein
MLETVFPKEDYQDASPPSQLPLLFMPYRYQMNPEGYFEDSYFREYRITSWLEDDYNSIFVGTWGMGPVLVDRRNLQAELIPCGLLQKQTDVIYLEGDSLWLGGNAGERIPEYQDARLGVTLYDRYRQEFTYFEPRMIDGFNSEIIYDITGDTKNLYFAGRQGLTIKSRSEDFFRTLTRVDGLPETETTALATGNDSLWIGTAQGLALYTPSVDTMVTVAAGILGNRFITDLEMAGPRLIIGTDRGAYYIDVASQKIGRLKDPNGNLGGLIRHISVDSNEVLISSEWGLTRINIDTEQASLVPFTDVSGGVYAAAGNYKYIAAVVDNGLLLTERETGKKRLFNEFDGLLSVYINVLVPDGDYLWIGSDQGLTRFKWVNPDRVD